MGLCRGTPLDSEDARRWKRYWIMKELHWDYHQYCSTPKHIIDEIYVMMKTEQRVNAFNQERQNA